MLHLPSKNLEGRRRDQGSRHRSISSQVWLVECPRAQLSSTVDYWRNFQPFPLTLLGTTLVFIRGGWSQESPGLRRSASNCWAGFCGGKLRGFEIVWDSLPSLRPSRRRQNWPSQRSWLKSTGSRSLCHFHSYFPSQAVDCPVVNVSVWFCRTAGGRRRMLMPRSTAAHRCPPLGQNRVLYL